MTDTASAAPSDAEIDAQWRESVEKHETTAAFVRDFARTVLAKWGAPPQISGFTVPQADSRPVPVVGTIAHVGTGKTTLTGAITSALRAASAPADSQPAPVLTSETGGDWTQPTSAALRLGDAMQLLCGGKRPPDDMVQQWLDNTSESLQEFAASNGPAWAQGIGLIDAALVMVDQPTEITAIDNPDRDHEHRTACAPADSVLEDAERWQTFIALPYATRAEWASNLSLAPVLTQWVDAARKQGAIHD